MPEEHPNNENEEQVRPEAEEEQARPAPEAEEAGPEHGPEAQEERFSEADILDMTPRKRHGDEPIDAASFFRHVDESAPAEEQERVPEEERQVTAADLFRRMDESAAEEALARQETARPAPKAEPELPREDAAREAEAEAEGEEDTEEAGELRDILHPPDDGIKRRWYALHAHSGQEGNVKKNIEVMAEQEGLADLIGAVFVPMEEVAEIKSGEKKISKRKFFPGYVLINLPEHPERSPELWHLIKNTPGVTGFIGSRTVPVPMEDAEVKAIVEEIRGESERPKPKVNFEIGERVKIIDGPFANFLGNVDEINVERGTIKVMVEIFERLTSVEVEFWQVEKI